MQLLLTVEELHDRTMLSGAEWLDRSLTFLYRQGPTVVALAQAYEGQERAGPVLTFAINRAAFDVVAEPHTGT